MTAPIPPEAITAAAAAITRELMSGKDYSMAIDSDEALAQAAVEAGAPIIVAAERERIRQLAIDQAGAPISIHPIASRALRVFADLIGGET